MNTQILVIDDDPHIVRMLRRVLRLDGHQVHAALDGREGLETASRSCVDLIILDILMPGPDGFSICQQLRRRTALPILMLTGLAEADLQVRGLDAGADDYLVKPFAAEVLLARVRALLRRAKPQAHDGIAASTVLRYADLSLHTGSQRAKRGERVMFLNATESRLLRFFLEHPERILSQQQLLEAIWGDEFSGISNVLAVQICGLRQKLEQDGYARLIHTIRGSGYVLRQ